MAKRTKKRKSKKSSPVLGTLILQAIGIAAFMFLFTHARAERQAAASAPAPSTPSIAAVQNMFEQTPLKSIFRQSAAQLNSQPNPSSVR